MTTELLEELKSDPSGKTLAGQIIEDTLIYSEYEISWETARLFLIDFLKNYYAQRKLLKKNKEGKVKVHFVFQFLQHCSLAIESNEFDSLKQCLDYLNVEIQNLDDSLLKRALQDQFSIITKTLDSGG